MEKKPTTGELMALVEKLQKQVTRLERGTRSSQSPKSVEHNSASQASDEASLSALREFDRRARSSTPPRRRSGSSQNFAAVKQPKQVDPFLVECMRAGITLLEIYEASKQNHEGSRTKFTVMCAAYITTLLNKPMSPERVWWCVVPDFDFDRRTTEGKRLVAQGLADSKWVANYREYLEALVWKDEQERRVRAKARDLRDTDSP